jgi:lipopolysaccharide biosynthesis regulator YciM
METGLLWGFLFLALLIGWVLGYHSKYVAQDSRVERSTPENTKHRLQLLFDSYSDDTIDKFIHSLEVTPDTLSIHISIGKHFRKQGEVEQAILIHQNLMAHPELSASDSELIIFELAKDYKAAGLFDRAQSLLEQLCHSRQFGFKSLKLLLDIHEQEKDWPRAVDVGKLIDSKKHPEISIRLAQYYCELAEERLNLNVLREAFELYKKALAANKLCIRALLGLSKLEIERKEYSVAIKHLKQVAELMPENITIMLPLLMLCTQASGSYEQHQLYLKRLYQTTGQVPILVSVVESMIAQGEDSKAGEFLVDQVRTAPSLSVLNLLFKLNRSSKIIDDVVIASIGDTIEAVSNEKSYFLCGQCGFSGGQLHWQCPSCKSWQTIKPVFDYGRPE